MAAQDLENVVSHWSKLVENFETSVNDFYSSVELALTQRKIPGLTLSRVDWNEGGVLSPRREYLRITGGRYACDVCAAPFGTGFFFSCWLVKKPAQWVAVFAILFLAAGLAIFYVAQKLSLPLQVAMAETVTGSLSLVLSVVLVFVAFVFDLCLVAIMARLGWGDFEAAIMALPLVGWIYEQNFAPQTYYRLDTIAMFRTAADGAVKDVIDGLLAAKGLRALSDEERKPVFQKFL